ncbi:pantoate--beta-alanine ligase [Listeria newyorkensis]|uniref:Pantothenate synthetase n=1 Tax=Listeria newyorkensis TaxID=1497681 RepID=A0ABX4XNL2_9LIST|nr:pantoate--beta-alanine ligase [Listeria newyorkensis]KGL41019.1 pantoate--beta-alanine ligase [Listeria newyorkensis]KMT57801.1 pantoate--beta-alanine ligase [Listeria newyorkensis]PNP92495.1 pantoate--beta-alanine ligase [Listeria newyorkensis]WAO21446.1 pantoate--beta-alanine ligase [Listeria newyorkensis]SQC56795.1 Pantothenate synthetase [Listeria newyorkensis]
MKIIREIEALQAAVRSYKKQQQTIGFVPTMGFLHEGHMALVKAAHMENDVVVMSIFVNPTQFGPNEDFESYPRDEARDTVRAEQNGVDILFMPSVETMYPESLTATIHAQKRVSVLDGATREGHFDGVLTVLGKLFHLVQPDNAYFGQKDAQQVAVVQGFVADYFFPLKICVVPTVREQDGLAKSSRNVYLTEQERKEAPVIHAALRKAREEVKGQDKASVLANIRAAIDQKNSYEKIVYLDMYQYPSFEPVEDWEKPIIIAICVQYSKARLIDNEIIGGA